MTTCVLCKKEFDGIGHNPAPLSQEGRCCEDCNFRRVIPERLKAQSHEDVSNTEMHTAYMDLINSDEVFFQNLKINENDRLRYFQFMKKYWNLKMEYYNEDDFIGKENMALLRAMWKTSFKASLDEAKVFVIEEDIVPMLLHTECEDGNFPFKSTFIDAKVKIKNRTYYGFHIGSYYTEKAEYKAILTVYTKMIMNKGTPQKFVFPDFIMLKKTAEDDVLNNAFRDDYFHKKVRHFCFSFCSFINEADVTEVKVPLNPKNNIRRQERGAMPLPEHINVVIHGKLRQYVDRQYESKGGTHRPFSYSFWVRGFYRHYRDKKRYAKLYAIDNDKLMSLGYTWSDKFDGILRRWVKPQKRGQGIMIKQSWEVKE